MLAGIQDCLAGILGFGEGFTADCHANEVFFRQRMCGSRRQILLKARQIPFVAFNLLREILQQPVFQTILLALMVSLHQAKTSHIHIQIHLFLDRRIPSAQGFDFRV